MYWLQKEWLRCISLNGLYFWWVSCKKIIPLVLCKYLYGHQTTLRLGEENKHVTDAQKRAQKCSHANASISRGTSSCPWTEHPTGVGPDKCLQLSLSLWVSGVRFIIWKSPINQGPSSAWVLGTFCLGLSKVQAKVYASMFSTIVVLIKERWAYNGKF